MLTVAADLGPADDPQRTRPHLRWEARAEHVDFVSVYAPAGAEIAGLRVERSGGQLTVHVDPAGSGPVSCTITPQEAP